MINLAIGNCDENLGAELLVSVVDEHGVYTGKHYHITSEEMLFTCVRENTHLVISQEVPRFLRAKDD